MNELKHLLADCFTNESSQPAILSSAGDYSYAQLNALRRQFEDVFIKLGLRPKMRVAFLLPKSATYVAAILAAIRQDLVYVPIDEEAPLSRARYIMEQAQCALLISLPELAQTLDEGLQHAILHTDTVAVQLTPDNKLNAHPQLAYVLYTSGSTGTPKGVQITHENATCFIRWAIDQFSVTSNSIVASIAPFHFDLSVFDLFASLSTGATTALFTGKETKNPRLFAALVADRGVNVLYATPSLLQLLLRYGKLERYDYSSLQTVLFAGEIFPTTPLRELSIIWPQAKFFNLYGPTETNVVTWHPIPSAVSQNRQLPYPIGRLCPYASAILKTKDGLAPLQPNRQGELLISGSSVTPAYLGLSELQSSHFYHYEEQIWYTTGDWVSVDEQEHLVYMGRIDRMVKRRGYRIELAEIEAGLIAHPSISSFGAIAIQAGNQPEIIGIFTATEPVSESDLKQFSANNLPIYMTPDRFISIEDMPLTSSQKIDYQALQKLAQQYV
jgi:amino acid adenylation domain-containing protein